MCSTPSSGYPAGNWTIRGSRKKPFPPQTCEMPVSAAIVSEKGQYQRHQNTICRFPSSVSSWHEDTVLSRSQVELKQAAVAGVGIVRGSGKRYLRQVTLSSTGMYRRISAAILSDDANPLDTKIQSADFPPSEAS